MNSDINDRGFYNLPDSKEEQKPDFENAAREYAVSHSAAPDKETPDWIIADFKAGANYGYNEAFKKFSLLKETATVALPYTIPVSEGESPEDQEEIREEVWRLSKECLSMLHFTNELKRFYDIKRIL